MRRRLSPKVFSTSDAHTLTLAMARVTKRLAWTLRQVALAQPGNNGRRIRTTCAVSGYAADEGRPERLPSVVKTSTPLAGEMTALTTWGNRCA
jgi:hypothetical protein